MGKLKLWQFKKMTRVYVNHIDLKKHYAKVWLELDESGRMVPRSLNFHEDNNEALQSWLMTNFGRDKLLEAKNILVSAKV